MSKVKGKPIKSSPIPTDVKYLDDYKTIFWNRTIGGFREGYFEYEIITETSELSEVLKIQQYDFSKSKQSRTVHAKVIIPAFAMKSFIQLFQNTLQNYESTYGQIPTATKAKKEEKVSTASNQPFIG